MSNMQFVTDSLFSFLQLDSVLNRV